MTADKKLLPVTAEISIIMNNEIRLDLRSLKI